MRKQILARYIPLVAHYITSNGGTRATSRPLELYGFSNGRILDDTERELVSAIAGALTRSGSISPGVTVTSYIEQLFDSNPEWRGHLVNAYAAAEAGQRAAQSPLQLGLSEYARAAGPSAVPPAITATQSAASPGGAAADTEVAACKENHKLAFDVQKNRLLFVLSAVALHGTDNAKMNELLKAMSDHGSPATKDEVDIAKKLLEMHKPEGGLMPEEAVEREAAKLVNANLKKNESYYTEVLYQGAVNNNIERIRAASRERLAKYKSDQTSAGKPLYPKQSWFWRVILKPLLMVMPVISIVSLFSALQELKGARNTGNRTWGNFILRGALSACVAIPSMMISLSLFGMPAALGAFGVAMNGLGVGMVGLTTKLALLVGAGALVANPIGAAILGAVLALVILAVVATVIYKGYQAWSASKYPEKFMEDSSTISPDMEKAYQENGYDVAAVKEAIKDLVVRIQELEIRSGHPAAKELAQLKAQLGALRGYYTGYLPSFSKADVVPNTDERWIKAVKAMDAYCKAQGLSGPVLRTSGEIASRAAAHKVDYPVRPRATASASASGLAASATAQSAPTSKSADSPYAYTIDGFGSGPAGQASGSSSTAFAPGATIT